MRMKDVISRGISLSDTIGFSCKFYPKMFIKSRSEWKNRIESLRMESDRLFDECYPDAYNGGSVGPIGEIYISSKDGYVYVYMMDARGNRNSVMFTHNAIAGEYTYVPPYGGYENSIKLSS